MVISTTALAISGVVAGLSMVVGALIANGQKDKAFAIENTIDNIGSATGIKNEDNTTDKPLLETLTEDTIKIEKPKEEQTTAPTIDNTTTLNANDRMSISKGNIIDNYMNGERANSQSQAAAPGITSGVIGYYDKNQFYDYPNVETKPVEKPIETPIGPEGDITEDDETSITPPPNITPDMPVIGDKTDENLEEEIPNTVESEWDKWYKLREEQWAREDAIRKETQEREDTAYQRAIADMKKAGLNPNIFGVNPAESGNGITQASMPDMGAITNQMNIDLKELQQLIDQNFQGDENTKDRLLQTFTSIISMIGMIVAFKKK